VAMRKIPFMSLKGGTGKSSCTAQTGLALRDLGYRLGLLDLDVHGPNLPLSLGLDTAPELDLDDEHETVIPPTVDGYQLMSMASFFKKGKRILWNGEDKMDLARQLLTGIIEWGDLDYLLIDTPPSQGEEILGLFEYLPDIHGVIIVCQPTDFAEADTQRVFDLLKTRSIPILGIVANMDGAICPDCGHRFYPFLTKRVDVEDFAQRYKVPLLASIAQVPDLELVKPLFAELAKKIVAMDVMKLPRGEKKRQFKREVIKSLFEEDDG